MLNVYLGSSPYLCYPILSELQGSLQSRVPAINVNEIL